MTARITAAEARELLKKPKQSKYRAESAYRCSECGAPFARGGPTPDYRCGGVRSLSPPCAPKIIRFDSKAEASRWHALRLLERSGKITGLQRQVPYSLYVGTVALGKYVADFVYMGADRHEHVEDVKGVLTPLAKWKIKHFEAQYGMHVEIVK